MRIFGRKAGSRAEAPGAADVFTAPERERVEALWRLTALPRAEFDATYGAMLDGFWRYAASARGEAWASLKRETLFCVVAERFAAVAGRAAALGWRPLTDDVPGTTALCGEAPSRPFGALLPAQLTGEAGLGWFGQEPAAVCALAAYFGEGAGWEWINWVRAGLRDGSAAVNAAGAWLHSIAGEAYVVSPACFEAFTAGRELAPATVRNRVVRLGRHRQRASPSGSANIFRAVLADGSRVKGMVFPGELFSDDDPPSRANDELVRKGR